MDADGSLLVIDTGGWYKLCCPTSQLWKPDVLGGIYRVRRDRRRAAGRSAGRQIAWAGLTADNCGLCWPMRGRPCDSGPPASLSVAATRKGWRRSSLNWPRDADAIVSSTQPAPLDAAGWSTARPVAALARTWAIAQLESRPSTAVIPTVARPSRREVRQAAMHAASLHRDAAATPQLLAIVASDAPANRRVAAEALGRIGDHGRRPALAGRGRSSRRSLPRTFDRLCADRVGRPGGDAAGLASDSPGTVAAALVALDQMPGGGFEPRQVIPLLSSHDEGLRHARALARGSPPRVGRRAGPMVRRAIGVASAGVRRRRGRPSATPANAEALESLLFGLRLARLYPRTAG